MRERQAQSTARSVAIYLLGVVQLMIAVSVMVAGVRGLAETATEETWWALSLLAVGAILFVTPFVLYRGDDA